MLINLHVVLDFVDDDIPDDALFRITKTRDKFYYGLDNTMVVMCKYSRFLLGNSGSLWVVYKDRSILELSKESLTNKIIIFYCININNILLWLF